MYVGKRKTPRPDSCQGNFSLRRGDDRHTNVFFKVEKRGWEAGRHEGWSGLGGSLVKQEVWVLGNWVLWQEDFEQWLAHLWGSDSIFTTFSCCCCYNPYFATGVGWVQQGLSFTTEMHKQVSHRELLRGSRWVAEEVFLLGRQTGIQS